MGFLERFPHSVYVHAEALAFGKSRIDFEELDKWCKEKIGEHLKDWFSEYADDSPYSVDMIYRFTNEKDATMFRLKWL